MRLSLQNPQKQMEGKRELNCKPKPHMTKRRKLLYHLPMHRMRHREETRHVPGEYQLFRGSAVASDALLPVPGIWE